MKLIQKISIPILIFMMFALPFWITLGKGLVFDIGGLVAFLTLFTVAPALFFVLLSFCLLLIFRKDVKENRMVGIMDAVLLMLLYLAIFLESLFTLDEDDTAQGLNSVMTKVANISLEASENLSIIFMLLSMLMIGILYGILIYEAIKRKAISSPIR